MTAKSHRGRVDSKWRSEQRRKHVLQYGLVCVGIEELDIPAHQVGSINDLQVDHIHPLHEGGHEHGPVRIVCKDCNTKHRNFTYSEKTQKERDHPPVEVPFIRGPLADL